MASKRDNGSGTTAVRLLINLSALALSAGIVALIIATIIVEID
jgi:hypothetical protein